jgi:hypothetical protein
MPVELVAGGCTATFVWEDDRWMHRLGGEAGEQSNWHSGWQSVEGPWQRDGDPRWPASPVLVELSRVNAAGGPAIVGVGLAGRTHFSASIAPDAHSPDAIRFEIAGRLHEAPGWLGSTYRSGGHVLRIVATDDGTAMPRTVSWAYSIGPQGIFGVVGATVITEVATERA